MKGHLDKPHPYGVDILLPEVIAFNLVVLPDKVTPLAEAFEIDTTGRTRAQVIAAIADAVRGLYRDIGFPDRFTHAQLPPDRVREIADRAVPGRYAGMAHQDFIQPAPRTIR